MMRITVIAALACGGAWGQTFEAATVKPSAPFTGGMFRVEMGGGPGSPDPSRINYTNVSMKALLERAYGVKSYQISGPAWIDAERYDIVATIAKGTTKEQFEVMLQNLLAERFRLAVHREKKELPAYALVVGKGGPKIKQSAEEAPGAEPEAPPVGFTPSNGPQKLALGKDGFPEAGKGQPLQMIMMPGRARLTMNKQTIEDLTNMLAMQVDRPVIDMTGLTGKYDLTLYFMPEGMGRGGMPMPPPGAPLPGMIDGGAHDPDAEPAPSLFTALQEQLGLKLESRRSPVDLIVVDRLEKVPAEN